MNKLIILERIEDDLATIEYDKKTFQVPLALIPENVVEGDVLDFTIRSDKKRTKERKAELNSLKEKLKRNK
ncbi:DUF3006 domain-containing protein [Halobacillus ihumii]|uniref:DUF3006 domain-containing protein n=1 Tax=Halobacillus ihumii TaxID=2686092 RepID=UPI0013D6E0AE|nr:DUF3006 domain-containing protein [Halobacillus ihumii]